MQAQQQPVHSRPPPQSASGLSLPHQQALQHQALHQAQVSDGTNVHIGIPVGFVPRPSVPGPAAVPFKLIAPASDVRTQPATVQGRRVLIVPAAGSGSGGVPALPSAGQPARPTLPGVTPERSAQSVANGQGAPPHRRGPHLAQHQQAQRGIAQPGLLTAGAAGRPPHPNGSMITSGAFTPSAKHALGVREGLPHGHQGSAQAPPLATPQPVRCCFPQMCVLSSVASCKSVRCSPLGSSALIPKGRQPVVCMRWT